MRNSILRCACFEDKRKQTNQQQAKQNVHVFQPDAGSHLMLSSLVDQSLALVRLDGNLPVATLDRFVPSAAIVGYALSPLNLPTWLLYELTAILIALPPESSVGAIMGTSKNRSFPEPVRVCCLTA